MNFISLFADHKATHRNSKYIASLSAHYSARPATGNRSKGKLYSSLFLLMLPIKIFNLVARRPNEIKWSHHAEGMTQRLPLTAVHTITQ